MTNPVYNNNNNGTWDPSEYITLVQPMWTPTEALPDSQAGTAYYYRVVSCSFQRCESLSHAEHSFDKLSRKVVLQPARHTLVDGSAPVVCPADATPPNQQVCQNDVTLSWQDYRTSEKSPYLPTPPTAERPFDVATRSRPPVAPRRRATSSRRRRTPTSTS